MPLCLRTESLIESDKEHKMIVNLDERKKKILCNHLLLESFQEMHPLLTQTHQPKKNKHPPIPSQLKLQSFVLIL